MQADSKPVVKGPMRAEKEESVLPNAPILRMMNTIPADAYQELLGTDTAMLAHFAHWNRIESDRENLVVSSSEADMSAASWRFRMESSWFPLQALAKPVPRNFASQCCPELASEPLVNRAVTAMMMGETRAGLPADSEVCRDRALPQRASGQRNSLVTIYLDGTSLAALAAVPRSSSSTSRG